MIHNKTLINEIELLKDKLLDLWDSKQHTTLQYKNLHNKLQNKELELLGKKAKHIEQDIIGGTIKKSLITRAPAYISNKPNNKYNYFSLQNMDYKFKINDYEFYSLVNFLTFVLFNKLPDKTTDLKYFIRDLTTNKKFDILDKLYKQTEYSDEENAQKILDSISKNVHYQLYIPYSFSAAYKKILDIGVRARITQNPDLIDKLIKTNNLVLLDTLRADNYLGQSLINLRTELKKDYKPSNIIDSKTKDIKLYKKIRN